MNFLLRVIVIAVALSHGTIQIFGVSIDAQSSQVGAADKEKPTSEISRLVIKSKPQPSYTKAARKNGVEGTVKLKITFQSDGKVGKVFVIEGLPDGLTEKAIAAAKKIVFEPAVKDGRPVSIYAQVNYSFELY